MKKHWKKIAAGIVILAAAWCLWYARPVDIHFLMGNQEAEVIGGTVWPQFNFPELTNANVEFLAGTPEMEDLMQHLESLRFHRSPLEPLFQILPTGITSIEVDPEKDYRIYLIAYSKGNQVLTQMQFDINRWTYYGPACPLPLFVSHGQEKGRELGAWLWEYSQENPSILLN